MFAAVALCCALAILGVQGNINDAIVIAALNQNNDDYSCQNPAAAYKKTVMVDQAAAAVGGNNGINNIFGGKRCGNTAAAVAAAAAINQADAINAIANQDIIGNNKIKQAILANLISNQVGQNSAGVINQFLAAKLGQDYSEAAVKNAIAKDIIVQAAINNPAINNQDIFNKANDIAIINQIVRQQSGINAAAAAIAAAGIQQNCQNNVNCISQVHAIAQVAAENVCVNNLAGNKIIDAKIACNAGAIVGKTVGQVYNNVCQVAAQKFQQKSQQCVSDSCIAKDAFIICCKNEEDAAKNIIAASIINN